MPLDTRTDAELLSAAKSDPQAFREIYERYAVWMRSWFQRQTGSEAVALDLTAETFAQAWRGVRRFRDLAEGSAAPWLFGIARNLLRQFHKHNRIETAARARLGLPIDWEGTEAYDAVDERLHASGLKPALNSAVRALPDDQRAALELRVIQQLGYDEISAKLGCSINAARLRVSRALRALTADLRESGV
jgi:RNA polymerase sigma factor (sigma-70 family)